VRRQAVSFRQRAACPEAGPDALAEEHLEVSSSVRLRREVCRDGSPVLHQQVASKALQQPEARSAMV